MRHPWWASLVAQRVKCLPAIQETWVQSLGWEDTLEKEIATHTSILAWRIPWIEEPGGLQSMGSQRVRHNWATNTHTHTHTHIITSGELMLTNHRIQTTHLDGLASWWARNHSWFSLLHQSPSFTYRVPIFGVYQVLGSKTEKEMATHSSTLAWKLPWMEEPGRLQLMGLLRVWHDWVTSLSRFIFMHWRKKWQPTPVF